MTFQVWYGFAIEVFHDLTDAAQFAYRKDGLVVYGDFPNTIVRNPIELLRYHN